MTVTFRSRRVYDVVNVFAALPVPLLRTSKFLFKDGKVCKYQYCGPDVSVDAITTDDFLSLPIEKNELTLFKALQPKEVSPAEAVIKVTLPDGQEVLLRGSLTIKLMRNQESNPEL